MDTDLHSESGPVSDAFINEVKNRLPIFFNTLPITANFYRENTTDCVTSVSDYQ